MVNSKPSKSKIEETSNNIIDFITSRQMLPGDKMPTEPELMEDLNVSRSTLREAIRTLSARNILEVRQGSGTFISKRCGVPSDPLGLTFIYDDDRLAIDLLDVRLMIEPQTALLAAIHATDEQCQKLLDQCALVEKLIQSNEEYEDEDIALHMMIAEASGNRVLTNLSYILHTSVKKNIISTADALRDNNTYVYHRRIVDAIVRHDATGAYNAMTIHVTMLWEFITAKLNSRG
ncbi:FadR/GntR family transcriptional regulator [uncultured Megasphaera sp.]|uniref:FadR/GntR family transcriptional regulator n=1 Tax=uncultured Megasphaera sp. TaxID=165188 RepID=UPI0025F26036|nr:FadR/GntR family transcriptional regulator [uncultured Megasphaera sp.]